jgi:hypothetical protein
MFAEQNAWVLRLAPDGRRARVAGRPTRPGVTGDGGPAVDAQLSGPASVLGEPDGGYLIADEDANRIRRVDATGMITTVGRIPGPVTMAGLPDGGFAVGTANGELYAVNPQGASRRLARTPYEDGFYGAISAATDGTLYLAESERVLRRAPDGTTTVAVTRHTHRFGGPGFVGVTVAADGSLLVCQQRPSRIIRMRADGRELTVLANRAFRQPGPDQLMPWGASALADGSLVVATNVGIFMFAQESPKPPVVALRRVLPSKRGMRAELESTEAGTLSLIVRGRGRIHDRRHQPIAAGRTLLPLRRLALGHYRVELVVRGPEGTARGASRLYVARHFATIFH